MEKITSMSVVLPAYNEAANIEESIIQASDIAKEVAHEYEIIVINDGSQDSTKMIAQRIAKRRRNIKVISQRNRGYGGALKRGFSLAKFDWIFFTDSDLQFDISELVRFVKYTKNYDMVLGYRKKRAEGWKRKFIADLLKGWNWIMLTFPRDIRDIDCAFKLIKKSVIKSVMPLYSDGAMVSTELLLKAKKEGYQYKQLGVRHYKRRAGQSTGSSLRVILNAIIDTFVLQRMLIKSSIKNINARQI